MKIRNQMPYVSGYGPLVESNLIHVRNILVDICSVALDRCVFEWPRLKKDEPDYPSNVPTVGYLLDLARVGLEHRVDGTLGLYRIGQI